MVEDHTLGSTIVKARFGSDIRKVVVHHNDDLSYNDLVLMMQRIFKIKSSVNISLKYKDKEGDLITLADDHDLLLALKTEQSPISIFVLPEGCELPQIKKLETNLENIRNLATALLDSLKTLDLGFESLLSDSNKNQSDLSVQHGETVATIQPSVHEQINNGTLGSNILSTATVDDVGLKELQSAPVSELDKHLISSSTPVVLQSKESERMGYIDNNETRNAFQPIKKLDSDPKPTGHGSLNEVILPPAPQFNSQIGSVHPLQNMVGIDQSKAASGMPNSAIRHQTPPIDNQFGISQNALANHPSFPAQNITSAPYMPMAEYVSSVSTACATPPNSYAVAGNQYGAPPAQVNPIPLSSQSTFSTSVNNQMAPTPPSMMHAGYPPVTSQPVSYNDPTAYRPSVQSMYNMTSNVTPVSSMQQRMSAPPVGPPVGAPPVMFTSGAQGANPFLRGPHTAHYTRPTFQQ